MTNISVFPDWMQTLPLQMQSVIVLGLRGPDGIRKYHPCKAVMRAYRSTVLKAAKYGRMITAEDEGDNFMDIRRFYDYGSWEHDVKEFERIVDELPAHFCDHLAHGAQILGYYHPDNFVRDRWLQFYLSYVDWKHMQPESKEMMDNRLNDWAQEYWNT